MFSYIYISRCMFFSPFFSLFSLLFSPFFLCRIRQLLDLNTFTFRLDLRLRPPNVKYILRTISSKNPKQSISTIISPTAVCLRVAKIWKIHPVSHVSLVKSVIKGNRDISINDVLHNMVLIETLESTI
jgi:hypothetical protein